MNSKVVFVFLVAVAAVVVADRRPFYGYADQDSFESESSESYESYESSEAKYDFSYAVRDDSSGNDFGHQESRDGDYTSGSYYVHLPDGRLQKVTYYVDGDSGYVAEVEYEGEAHYPDSFEGYESESFESYESESFESSESRGYYAPPRRTYG